MREEDSRSIGVLIVSDSHIIRSGLRRILESQTNILVLDDVSIEKAGTIDSLLRQQPDLIIVEIDSRVNDPLDFIGNQALKKDLAVLVLTDLADHELAFKALALGAAGVVLKIQPPGVLIAAIQGLCPRYRHESSVPKNLGIEAKQTNRQKLFQPYKTGLESKRNIGSLTTREREIIGLVGQGLKNKDIANRLSISDITVRHHLTSIFCKLDVEDRQKLLIFAHCNGLTELSLSTESA